MGTWTTIEQPPYMVFIQEIQKLANPMEWSGPTIESVYGQDSVIVRMACSHGQMIEEMISYTVWEGSLPVPLANLVMQRFQHRCQSEHANIPPPGQFVYSLASPEPIAYAANNVIYKIEDFKIQYAAEYAKLVESQMQSLYSTGDAIGGSWSFTPTYSSGIGYGGTGSILTELLSICPGLGSVQRPCPDTSCAEYSGHPILLPNLIQHVNDRHQWSREKIAEWLDIIAIEDPTVDLTIKPKEKKSEQPSIGPSAEEVTKLYGNLALGTNTVQELAKAVYGYSGGEGVD